MFPNWMNFETSLLDQFQRLQHEMDELLNPRGGPAYIRAMTRGNFPAMNVGTTPEAVDLYVFAAGLDPTSLDMNIQQNVLTIAGERKHQDGADEKRNYYLKERFNGSFSRAVTLPEDVDPDKVDATYKDGILHVRIHKSEASKPRRIEVKV